MKRRATHTPSSVAELHGMYCAADTGQLIADPAARFHSQGKRIRHARAQAVFEKQQTGQPKQKHKPRQEEQSEQQQQQQPPPASASSPPAAAAGPTAPDPSQRWAGGALDLSLHWHLSKQDLHGSHHVYDCWPRVSPIHPFLATPCSPPCRPLFGWPLCKFSACSYDH